MLPVRRVCPTLCRPLGGLCVRQAATTTTPSTPSLSHPHVVISHLFMCSSWNRFDPRSLDLTRRAKAQLEAYLPPSVEPSVVDMQVSSRDGSVCLSLADDVDPASVAAAINTRIQEHTANQSMLETLWRRVVYMGRPPVAVLAFAPWMDDIRASYSSWSLRVDVMPPDPARQSVVYPVPAALAVRLDTDAALQQYVYRVFRHFGPLYRLQPIGRDTTTTSPPPALSGTGAFFVQYTSVFDATVAKLALQGAPLPGGRMLYIESVPYTSVRWLKQLYQNNLRALLMLMALLFAGLSVVVLEPIRVFSVKAFVLRWFSLPQLAGWRQNIDSLFATHIRGRTGFRCESAAATQSCATTQPRMASAGDSTASSPTTPVHTPPAAQHKDKEQDVFDAVLAQRIDAARTPIVLTGRRGMGKSQIVSRVTQSRTHVVRVDVRRILAHKNSADAVDAFARAFGFWPTFRASQLSSTLLDSLSPGVSAAMRGGSEEEEMAHVLDTVRTALVDIQRSKSTGPPQSPLFVFFGFNEDNANVHKRLLPILSQWASTVTAEDSAQVLFVTNYSPLTDDINGLSPGRRPETVELTDVGATVAVEFVLANATPACRGRLFESSASDPPVLRPAAKAAVELLDGRIADLDDFVHKVNAGMDAGAAVGLMVNVAESRVRRTLLLSPSTVSAPLWAVITLLVEANCVSYDKVLFGVCKGKDEVLRQLLSTELLDVQYEDGVPRYVRAGSRLLLSAFQTLVDNSEFNRGMQAPVSEANNAKLTAKLRELEKELEVLETLASGGGGGGGWRGDGGGGQTGALVARRKAAVLAEVKATLDKY